MTQDPRALLQEAEKWKKAARGTWKFFGADVFGNEMHRYEEAVKFYIKAANVFRLQDRGNEAGLAFENAAVIQKNNIGEQDDAANNLVEASKSYRKHEPINAIRVLQQAIDHYTENGGFRRAATQVEDMADIYDFDIGDKKKAADLYEKAAGWLDIEKAKQTSKKLRLKAADNFAVIGDYAKAIELFEKIVLFKEDANKYFVDDLLQKAGICALAVGGEAEIKTKLTIYTGGKPKEQDIKGDESREKSSKRNEYEVFKFNLSREYRLLADLAEAVSQGDRESFQNIVDRYDDLGRLGEWKEMLLQRAKFKIDNAFA